MSPHQTTSKKKTMMTLGRALSMVLMVTQLQSVVAQDRSDDWMRLEEWILIDRSFSAPQRRAALGIVDRMVEQKPQMSDAEFYLQVRKIAAMANNGHSNVGTAPIYEQFGIVPLRTYWFSDGLYIVRAKDHLSPLVGGKITAVEGLPIDELVDKLRVYNGGTLPFFKYNTASALALSPALMAAAKISEDAALTMRVTRADGEEEEVTFLPQDVLKGVPRIRPWRGMIPSAIEGEGNTWVSALDAEANLPLALQDEKALFRYELLDGGDKAYIQFRANIGNTPVPIDDFVNNTLARLRRDKPRIIILDNRFNGGGNLTRTADLGLMLPSLVPDEGKVIVLTGNGTFSAGIYTSFYPKAANADKTIVVGEIVGDRPRFWAETWRRFKLPQTGYGINYSLQLHDLGAGCDDKETCHLTYNDTWNVAIGSLAPDVPVETTLADFKAGRDPVLEAALRLAKRSADNN